MQTISLNKKISKFYTLVGVLIFIATLMSIWCASTAINNAMVTTAVKPSYVIYTQTEVNNYLTQMAKDKNDTASNISIARLGTGKKNTTSVPNLSQTDMNNMYNARNNTNYNGTCTIVADTQALKRFTNQTNTNNIFESTLDEAIRIKAFIPPDEGTYSSKNDTLMDNMFNFYSDSTDANNDHLNIPSTLVKEVAADRAVVLHVPTHSVVVTGYENYRVTYEERYWSWFKYKYRYTSFDTVVFEVNNGWGVYSNDKIFYPADAINNTTTYGITKFID